MKTKVPYGMKDYTIHGTELEPFHIYHQIYEHGGLQVPFHWHKEMEWIWVEKGSLDPWHAAKNSSEAGLCDDQQL